MNIHILNVIYSKEKRSLVAVINCNFLPEIEI